MNTTLDNVLDSDEHVRFSLFDQNNVEKSYDIDLSEIIHSYTYKGDSVEIRTPSKGITEISIRCPYCTFDKRDENITLCQYSSACQYRSDGVKVITVGMDSTWGNFYLFDQYLSNQSSMKSDSVKVYGKISFR